MEEHGGKLRFHDKDILTSDTTLYACPEAAVVRYHPQMDSFQTDHQGSQQRKFSKLPVRSMTITLFIGWMNNGQNFHGQSNIPPTTPHLLPSGSSCSSISRSRIHSRQTLLSKVPATEKFPLPVRSHDDQDHRMEEHGGDNIHQDNILTSDTTLVAVWEAAAIRHNVKDSFQTDSVIKGASNGKFTLPVHAAMTTTLSSGGRTWTERHSLPKISSPAAYHVSGRLEAVAVRYHVKKTVPDWLPDQGRQQRKVQIACTPNMTTSFIGWMNRKAPLSRRPAFLTSDTVIYANWKQLQFNITLKQEKNRPKIRVPATEIHLPTCATKTTNLSSGMEEQGRAKLSLPKDIPTSDTTLVAGLEELQFDITLKGGSDRPVIKGAPATESSRCQYAAIRPHFHRMEEQCRDNIHQDNIPHQRHDFGGCLETAAVDITLKTHSRPTLPL